MNNADIGLIYFNGGSKEELFAIALFKGGRCYQYIYNESILEELLQEKFGNLYQVPEYLGSAEAMVGMQQSFWDNFMSNTGASSFIKFHKVKNYTFDKFKEIAEGSPIMNRLIENGNRD